MAAIMDVTKYELSIMQFTEMNQTNASISCMSQK